MDGNFTALVAVLVTWAGVVLYLIRIDRKVSRRSQNHE